MTREERAKRWLADYFDQHGKHGGADELRDGRMITMTSITAVNAMLQFADAEAAAMRERAAKKADSWAAREEEEGEGGGRVWSASLGIATAIRALPATGEE